MGSGQQNNLFRGPSCHPPITLFNHQKSALTPLVVNVSVKCKPQTSPHPASLTSTAAPSIRLNFLGNPPLLERKGFSRTPRTCAHASLCSLTLSQCQPGPFSPCRESLCGFSSLRSRPSNRLCISWRRLIQSAHKMPGLLPSICSRVISYITLVTPGQL